MAKKRKNFIREKRIYCGEEYLEVDIVAVTNMPEAGKGKKGKSSQAQKNLNDKRSKRRFVQIANTNFGTNDFHISATYNNEHLPMSLEEAEKNVHNYLDRIKRKMKRETGEDLKYMLVTEYTPEEEEGQLTLQGIDADDKTTKAVRIHHHIIINNGGLDRDDLELMWSTTRINWKKANDPEYRANVDYYGFVNCDRLQPNENGLEGIVKIDETVIGFAVYEDATEYIGISEVTLPEISNITEEISGAGIGGKIESVILGAIEAMSLTLNFRTVTNNAIKLHEPRQHNIDLRAAQQQKDTVKGTTEVVSVKHILVVTPKKLNPGKVATAAAAEVSGEYAVSYYATYIDGKKKLEIDPLNYIYYVNGKDYLADVRKALGK